MFEYLFLIVENTTFGNYRAIYKMNEHLGCYELVRGRPFFVDQ